MSVASSAVSVRASVLYGVFVLSGASALLYQVVWQRALLTIYGTNTESVAVVVAAFMLGLGFGAFAGGRLSREPRRPLLLYFAAIEFAIGLYGAFSLSLFGWVGASTAGSEPLATGLLSFGLVLLPTLLMGSTLPLLVAHQVRHETSVGRSVGMLYFVNTLGAALGAFAAVGVVLWVVGLPGTVALAVILNVVTGGIVLAARRRGRSA